MERNRGEILKLWRPIAPKPRRLRNSPIVIKILRSLAIVFFKIAQKFARLGPEISWVPPPLKQGYLSSRSLKADDCFPQRPLPRPSFSSLPIPSLLSLLPFTFSII